ncbi:sulfotransferase domain-containing protein [Candidatus Pelagibacter sp.]|nr:sulfotransferase domain-containing protein [Candidatus Pelagibacter sp.]
MIIWLSSYPKSGNTWLRSLLATYFFSKSGEFNFKILNEIDSYPSVRYFEKYKDSFSTPESTSKYWLKEQEKINQDKKVRFFKTHNAMCKIYGNSFTDNTNSLGAIHIVRDPRNVITSLSNHYQIDYKEALDFMKTENKAIIEKKNNRYLGFNALFSWSFHEKSWSECKKFPILTVRYEDLEQKTYETFKNIFNFIIRISGIKNTFDKEKAKKVIKECQFENLQKLEQIEGFREAVFKKGTKEKIKFFNMGKKNDFRKLLDKELVEEMNILYEEQLNKYNYN